MTLRLLPLIALLAGIAVGCGGARPVAQQPVRMGAEDAPENTEASNRRAQVMRLFMDATKARLNGQYGKATLLYEQCLKADPTNHAAMFELAKLQHMQQRPAEALNWAKRAQSLDKENIWYRFLLADMYGQAGQLEQSIEVYRGIVQKWPDRHEVRFQLAHTLAMAGRTDEARKVFKDLRAQLGDTEEIIGQEYSMLANSGKLTEARDVLQKALTTAPDHPGYMGMLAELYITMGEEEMALALYRRILELDPDDSMTRIALAEYHYGKGEMDPAFEQLGLAFGDPDLDIDAKMHVLLGFYEMTLAEGQGTTEQQDLLQRTYTLVDILTKAHPESGKPLTIRGDLLLRDGRLPEARDAFAQAVTFEQDKMPIWMQLMQLDLQLQDHEALKRHSGEAIELFPLIPESHLYLGIAHSQLGEHEQAIEALVAGRDLVVDDDALLARFWSSLGDAYHEAARHDRSDDAFEKALKLEPRDPTTLNNYAYYLSVRGDKLDRAADMSRQSNEIAPGQASFQDTYAWVLFRQGAYAEARVWIEKAMASGGANEGVIVEHFGDILYALGEREEAWVQWKKAMDLGGGSEELPAKAASGRPPQQ